MMYFRFECNSRSPNDFRYMKFIYLHFGEVKQRKEEILAAKNTTETSS